MFKVVLALCLVGCAMAVPVVYYTDDGTFPQHFDGTPYMVVFPVSVHGQGGIQNGHPSGQVGVTGSTSHGNWEFSGGVDHNLGNNANNYHAGVTYHFG